MINTILIVSFILDGLFSVYQGIYIFKPIFTITSLIIIFPLCHRNYNRYYKICIILGLFYDLIYTNTLVFNAFLFLIICLVTKTLYSYFSELSLLSTLIINIIGILIYKVLSYIILILIGYLSFNILEFTNNLIGNIITNTLFYLVIYLIITYITNRRSKGLIHRL